jgi:hypothetical protein
LHKKASNVCNLILSNVFHVNRSTLVNLFKCYARPYLEYASVIFSPHYLYQINLIEKVQRNFTKRLNGLRDVSYSNRLRECKLEPLELRRIHSDLIFLYKVINKLNVCDIEHCIKFSTNTCTRGNRMKLNKQHIHLDIRKYFFSHRVIDM